MSTFFGTDTPLRWQIADSSRIYQDEYLEWSVLRDGKDPLDFSSNIVSEYLSVSNNVYVAHHVTRLQLHL